MLKRWGLVVCALMVWGCAEKGSAPASSVSVKDGEIAFPASYQNWAKFLPEVQRPDAKQVRELFINAVGAKTKAGQPFANGTVMVMELHKAKLDGDTPTTGPDGKLAKGELAKIFVMAKGEGWGQDVPEYLRTGNWLYAAYSPDGTPLAEDFNKCRACHVPLAAKDFVHRYDEYFEKRTAP